MKVKYDDTVFFKYLVSRGQAYDKKTLNLLKNEA